MSTPRVSYTLAMSFKSGPHQIDGGDPDTTTQPGAMYDPANFHRNVTVLVMASEQLQSAIRTLDITPIRSEHTAPRPANDVQRASLPQQIRRCKLIEKLRECGSFLRTSCVR